MKNIVLIYIFLIASFNVGYCQEDILSSLRTNKKIITTTEANAPYYAIQILALEEPPQNAEFFQNIDVVKEYICEDGYVRYVVGEYHTFSEAAKDLDLYKEKGYTDVFVVNTKKLLVKNQSTNSSKLVIDPNKDYLIQLSAFRFPVYLSHFENIDDILEFYMKDKIFRYCTNVISGTEVEQELDRIKGLGYNNAFIVDYEKYKAFKIE